MKTIVGVMGPGEKATAADVDRAESLGRLIAENGWVLLSGGRDAGVMHASCKGAKAAGGLVIGILPGNDRSGMSEHVDLPVVTGMGSARNNINILSCDALIACGMEAGTASEVALALKAKKPVILLSDRPESHAFFRSLATNLVTIAATPEEAVAAVKAQFAKK